MSTDRNSKTVISGTDQMDAWQTKNQQAWDRMAERGHVLARPATDQQFANPLASVDAPGWLGQSIQGQQVLCLAAGGGRQGPLYAAAGGEVTVVDLSHSMLQIDQQVARERGLKLQTVQTSMTDLKMFADRQFDLVIHPVSTCYVPDLQPVYSEIARVMRTGGLYISQHKQPVNLQATLVPDAGRYFIQQEYYREQALPTFQGKSQLREPGVNEYVHRWGQLIGWMCQAGFVAEDVLEPNHARPDAAPGTLGHRSRYISPYIRIKARRT